MNENLIFEIVKTWWVYIVYVGEYDTDKRKWKKEYEIDRVYKTLKWAENFVLKCRWLYEKGRSHEEVVQKLRKCLSYRSYEKLYIRKIGK